MTGILVEVRHGEEHFVTVLLASLGETMNVELALDGLRLGHENASLGLHLDGLIADHLGHVQVLQQGARC